MILVLITGDRFWADRGAMEMVADKLISKYGRHKILVIQGGADGADLMAKDVFEERGVHVATIDALWNSYGRGAGPRRNAVMAVLPISVTIAFHNELFGRSRGTADMVRRSLRKGTPTFLWSRGKLRKLVRRHADSLAIRKANLK